MADRKYVVLSMADWERLNDRIQDVDQHLFPIEDAEVIRKQDMTSGPIFHMYSSMILSYLELAKLRPGTWAPQLTLAEQDNLRAIADHFHEAAMDAESFPKRLPT